MKTFCNILIAALLLAGVGCAKEQAPDAAPSSVAAGCTSRCDTGTGAGPSPPTGVGDTQAQSGYYSGSTAALTADMSALRQMFFNSNPNTPTNVRINIDLTRPNDTVIISYVDTGKGNKLVEAALGSQNPCVRTGYQPCDSTTKAQFNGWVNENGQSVWKGFFQDEYGAIVLIVDKVLSQGDGQAAQYVGGSIWFQNFNRYYPNYGYQGPLKMCWEISMGPYDCRTFLVGNYVNVLSSQYPNNKGPDQVNYYRKLGEFSGITRAKAGL